jgi:hypothetical protein
MGGVLGPPAEGHDPVEDRGPVDPLAAPAVEAAVVDRDGEREDRGAAGRVVQGGLVGCR